LACSESTATRCVSGSACLGSCRRPGETGATGPSRPDPRRAPTPSTVDSLTVPTRARSLPLVCLLAACAVIARARVGSEPVPGQPPPPVEGGSRTTNAAFTRASTAARFAFTWKRAWAPARTITVPREANDGAALRANGSEATVTWIGHATVLVQLDGVNLLTDPHWGERASPVSFAGPKRLQPPGLAFEVLPPSHL